MSPTEALDPALAARILAEIDRTQGELIALTQDLVRIPSENPKLSGREDGGESNVQDRVARVMDEIGAVQDRWDALPGRPNLVGTVKGAGGGPSLAVNGHIDVVPAGDLADWSHDPWSADLVDGEIWGRGASDMKGGVAAMLHAALVLKRLGIHLKGDLFIESVIDEETGGPGTRETITRGYRPDFALVTESSPRDTCYPVEGGLEWLRLTIVGKAGHSAYRYASVHAGGQGTAVNAIEKGVRILNAVADLERAWAVRKVHPLMPRGITTINPGVIAGGTGGGKDGLPNVMTSVSTMADYCSLELSLKYLPSENTADVRREFEEFIHYVCQTDEWLREHPPAIEWGLRGVSFPPANTDLNHPAMTALMDSIRTIAGEARAEGFIAVSDIAWFGEVGIPTAIYGPNSGFGAHGVDERGSVSGITDCCKVVALFMASWCGVSAN